MIQIPAALDKNDNTNGFVVSEFPNVWKVFSQTPLSEKDIKDIFINVVETKNAESIYVADWLAYPEYQVGQKEAKSANFREEIEQTAVFAYKGRRSGWLH